MDTQSIIFAAKQTGLAIPEPEVNYNLTSEPGELVAPLAWPAWRVAAIADDDPHLAQVVNFLTLTGWHPIVLPHDDMEACRGWLSKLVSWGLAHFA